MQKVVLTLEAFASDPETQATVERYIQDAVCTSLPPQFAQMCTQVGHYQQLVDAPTSCIPLAACVLSVVDKPVCCSSCGQGWLPPLGGS
jgi:hypothetical protein